MASGATNYLDLGAVQVKTDQTTSSNTSYLSTGAVQPQSAAAGGGVSVAPRMTLMGVG